MKKIVSIAVFMAGFWFFSQAQQKPENCPFGGKTDCTGECGRFNDHNNDSYCDFARLSAAQTQKTIEENKKDTLVPVVSSVTSVSAGTTNVSNAGVSQKEKDEQVSRTFDSLQSLSPTVEEPETEQEISFSNKTPYHFWLMVISCLVLYGVGELSVKYGRLKKTVHRKIWNTILLVSFLMSCLIGLYLVLAKMYSLSMDYSLLIALHVDVGTIMTVVALIHTFWHLKYFKNLFKH